jgi:hypothetical protein
MASIDKPSEDEDHHTFLSDLELMKFDITSLDSRLGEFSRESSVTPSLDPYPPVYHFQNLPLNSLLSIPLNICVLYFPHVLMGPIKELP